MERTIKAVLAILAVAFILLAQTPLPSPVIGGGSGGGGGNVSCSNLPALTGDTTTSAGSCATTTAKINGTAVPSSTAILGTNSSSQPVAATSSSVVGLFTGCSGSLYLGADGACHSSGGGVSTQSVVTGSRAFGTVYHNTNATAMFVTVSGTTSAGGDAVLMTAITDSSSSPSTTVAQDQSTLSVTGGAVSLTFVVLPGNYYEATLSGNGTLAVSYWTEWH